MSTANKFLVVEGVAGLVAGFQESSKLVQRWTRSELGRGGKRVIREYRKEWLHGGRGIKGGQFLKGKHAFSFLNFNPDDVTVGLSRILRVHEEGATITPKRGGALFLSEKTGVKGGGNIFAVVPKVVIPARTGFRMTVAHQAPAIAEKVGAASVRAIQEGMKRNVTRILKTSGI